jgi:hypothetical protein
MADGTGGPGPGSEDEFDRQLRALTEGSAGEARFREPSAAERAKAAAEQARQARKRAARAAAEAKRGRAERAARRDETRGGGIRLGRLRALVVFGACLAVLIGLTWVRLDHPAGGGPGDTVKGGAVPSTGALATARQSPASPAAVVTGPPADPFATTPAQDWADGAAGIVVPPARTTGSYSAAQVSAAYSTTKKLLIAAALDRQTLLGGAPTAFADLLTAMQRTQFLAGLGKTGVDKRGNPASTRAWVISFAPDSTVLIGSVIKVYGVMSAHAGTDHGRPVLDVEVNYRFVYPVEPPHVAADWRRVIGDVHGPVEFGDWARASTPFQPWVLFSAAVAGDRCDVHDGYVHPDYANGTPDRVQPSGAPIDPFSLATPQGSGCEAATRT